MNDAPLQGLGVKQAENNLEDSKPLRIQPAFYHGCPFQPSIDLLGPSNQYSFPFIIL
jgi:hypothetical protein